MRRLRVGSDRHPFDPRTIGLARTLARREYEVGASAEGLQPPNCAHDLRTYFDARGEVTHEGARVEIRRPGLVEWYVNSEDGLEQGFTPA